MTPVLLPTIRRIGACLALVLLIASCVGPQLFHPQLSALDKGLSQTEVINRLKLPPISAHTASVAGRTIEFHKYHLNNGIQSDLYLLAYEKERLLFWGYVNEFRRQPDAELNTALSIALRNIIAGS